MVADVNLNYNIIDCEINKAPLDIDKLYKQLRLTIPYSLQYDALKYNLKAYNSVLKRSIRLANKIYFAARFTNCKYDIKKHGKQ